MQYIFVSTTFRADISRCRPSHNHVDIVDSVDFSDDSVHLLSRCRHFASFETIFSKLYTIEFFLQRCTSALQTFHTALLYRCRPLPSFIYGSNTMHAHLFLMAHFPSKQLSSALVCSCKKTENCANILRGHLVSRVQAFLLTR